jgi:hypothetical protein
MKIKRKKRTRLIENKPMIQLLTSLEFKIKSCESWSNVTWLTWLVQNNSKTIKKYYNEVERKKKRERERIGGTYFTIHSEANVLHPTSFSIG